MVERMPLMAGNWKMNLNHLEAIAVVQRLAFGLKREDFDHCEVAVLAPFTDLRSVQTLVDADRLKILYGAQDVSAHESGAYTGEVSASMLSKLGCTYVIVGHSERRAYHQESDELVARKAQRVIDAGMTAIVCVGEDLEVRHSGEAVAHTVSQLKKSLALVPEDRTTRLVVAYEPVWAIGTGEVATPDDAQEVCAAIRAELETLYSASAAESIRVLYGGSMKAGNVAGLMQQPDIDGGLVGGASLDPDEFVTMVRYRLHPAT